jgi:hypothetical protein
VDDNRIIYDNFRRNSLLRKPELANHPNVRIIQGDILDPELPQSSRDSINIVVHVIDC